MIRIEFSADLVEIVELGALPENWNGYPPGASTQRIGDAWLAEQRTTILAVPSAIVPQERNYLVNPAHADFAAIRIGTTEPFEFDQRLVT